MKERMKEAKEEVESEQQNKLDISSGIKLFFIFSSDYVPVQSWIDLLPLNLQRLVFVCRMQATIVLTEEEGK